MLNELLYSRWLRHKFRKQVEWELNNNRKNVSVLARQYVCSVIISHKLILFKINLRDQRFTEPNQKHLDFVFGFSFKHCILYTRKLCMMYCIHDMDETFYTIENAILPFSFSILQLEVRIRKAFRLRVWNNGNRFKESVLKWHIIIY